MVTAFDVHPEALINKAAEALKKEEAVEAPEWAKFVKTSQSRERPPINQDWWYVRAAAILRTVYMKGPIGVSKLRSKYGGNKNRGLRPKHFRRASGNIIRKCLQQLQTAGYLETSDKGIHKGRVVSGKGRQLLDNLSKEL
jgi:small subunit ribosomal protein S19e